METPLRVFVVYCPKGPFCTFDEARADQYAADHHGRVVQFSPSPGQFMRRDENAQEESLVPVSPPD